jgi:MoxR-like ATPase
MFKIVVEYPSIEEEKRVMRQTTGGSEQTVQPVIDGATLIALQQTVRRIPASEHMIDYVARLVRATRVTEKDIPDFVRDYVSWGAGPRACQCLILAGKARAALRGRYHLAAEDVAAVARPALRHRIVTNFNADADNMTTDRLVEKLVETVKANDSAIARDPEAKVLAKA